MMIPKRISLFLTSPLTTLIFLKNIKFTMDNSFYYDTDTINFIKILFRIFVGFIIIVFVLIFTLELNDTVKFKEGQIYSDSPQLKLSAPNEAKVIKTLVKEGQDIKKGDT